MQTHTFTLEGGLQVVCDVTGPDSGPPVVLLHGFGQTRRAWKKTIAVLARQGFRAYAVDMRGHGESDWSEDGKYDLDHYSNDVREVLGQIGRPVAMVGASLGGIAALIALGEPPQVRVSCLVLVDITSRVSEQGISKIRMFMEANANGFASVEDAAASVSRYLPNRLPPKDLSGLMNNLRKGKDGRLYWHWDPAALSTTRWGDRAVIEDRIERAAANVNAPTLILRGGNSELVTLEAAQAFVMLLKMGELSDIDGAHHMVAGDRNDAFTQALVEYIVRHSLH